MRRRLVLNDFEGADASALVTPCAQKQAAVARGAKQNGAGAGKISAGIEVFRNPHGMAQDGCVRIVLSIDVDAPEELDEFSGLGAIVAASLVEVLSDEVESHV